MFIITHFKWTTCCLFYICYSDPFCNFQQVSDPSLLSILNTTCTYIITCLFVHMYTYNFSNNTINTVNGTGASQNV